MKGPRGPRPPGKTPRPPLGLRAADRQSAGGGARIPAGRGRKGPEIGQRPPGSRLPAPDRLYCVARRRARPRLVPRGRRRRPAIGARARRRSTGNQTGARPEAETGGGAEHLVGGRALDGARAPGRRPAAWSTSARSSRGAWSEPAAWSTTAAPTSRPGRSSGRLVGARRRRRASYRALAPAGAVELADDTGAPGRRGPAKKYGRFSPISLDGFARTPYGHP